MAAVKNLDVTFYGPNLSRAGQKLGDTHVHATGCAHEKLYGPDKRYGGDDVAGWDVKEMHTIKECILTLFPPDEFDYDEADWAEYRANIYFAPCVKRKLVTE